MEVSFVRVKRRAFINTFKVEINTTARVVVCCQIPEIVRFRSALNKVKSERQKGRLCSHPHIPGLGLTHLI